jgi:hypothetical protein
MRSYEVMAGLGPVLAAMTVWMVWRGRFRRRLWTSGLYLLSAALFVAGTIIAVRSVLDYEDPAYLAMSLREGGTVGRLLPFELCCGAAFVVVAWSLLRPQDLRGNRPYLWGGALLALLALSPLLALADVAIKPPYAYWHYVGRIGAAPLALAVILFMWIYKFDGRWRPAAFSVLEAPAASRRLLAFACVMLLAALPWYVVLAGLYISYLEQVRASIALHSGLIAFEDTPLPRHPRLLQGDGWQLVTLSLVLRQKPTEGVIVPPKGEEGYQPYPLSNLPQLGRFTWR